MFARKILFWMSLMGCLAVAACADDGYISGVGGTIRLMSEHPSIRMASERVHVTVTPDRAFVAARFVLENTAGPVTVRIGFPEGGGGGEVKHPRFKRFASTVDGRPVRVRTTPWAGERDLQRWRVKTLRFARKQTRIVQVRYQAPTGRNVGGTRNFVCILKTGASWKGPIGSATVVADLSAIRDYQTRNYYPKNCVPRGDTVQWHFQDFEPEENIGIAFHHAFLSFVRGHREFRPYVRYLPARDSDPATEPRIADGVLMTPAETLVSLLGGSAQWHPESHVLLFRRKRQRAQAQAPGNAVRVGGKEYPLPRPIRIERGRAMIPMAAFARALGVDIRYDRAGRRIRVAGD